MNRVYDMSSGRMIESFDLADEPYPYRNDLRASTTELQLQLVVPEKRPERTIPPELVLADLNAFIESMS